MYFKSNWSPNYLSATPYHLQLRNMLLKAIEEDRFKSDITLPQPQQFLVRSLFQKAYALKAYDLLVEEGKLGYTAETGYHIQRKAIKC